MVREIPRVTWSLGEVINTLMSDPEYNPNDSLLVNINDITLSTKKVHYVEAVELVNLGFASEIVDIVRTELNNQASLD